MLASGFILRTDHHFQVAFYNKVPVTVWQQGQILEYGGPIDKISDLSVWINGAAYLRVAYEFKVR